MTDAGYALIALGNWGSSRNWLGPDPYEGLNATRIPRPRRPFARRLLIQAVKRSPMDLRTPLGIAPRPNAAALAQVLSAYARMTALGLPSEIPWSQRLDALVGRLATLRSTEAALPCWGYPFDVSTRFFSYPHHSPNTIATAFAGLGMVEAHERGEAAEALSLAVGAAEFLADRMQRSDSTGVYFAYLPNDSTVVHNANVLACALLARAGAAAGRADLADLARQGVNHALAHQRDDGAWVYAEGTHGDWVDGFHSGYVLDGLAACADALNYEAARTAYRRGLAFFAEHLVTRQGEAKFFVDRTYPIDGQCVAQALKTLSLGSAGDPSLRARADAVCSFALERMRRPDHAFIYQRHRLWTNRIPHVRWVQAPMLEALAIFAGLDRADARRVA